MLEIYVTMATTLSNCFKYTWNTIFWANLLMTENQKCLLTIHHVVYTYQNQKVILWSILCNHGKKASNRLWIYLKIVFKANSLMKDKQMCIQTLRSTFEYSPPHTHTHPSSSFFFFFLVVTEPNPTLNIIFYVQWSMKFWSRLNMDYCYQ